MLCERKNNFSWNIKTLGTSNRYDVQTGVAMRNLKKYNPLSEYSFNCLNDIDGTELSKNVNDNEPLFIVILKSTFA